MTGLPQPQLPLNTYRFHYEAEREIKIPPFPGKLLHGALGNALRKTLCQRPKLPACEPCTEQANCGYRYLFRNNLAPIAGNIQQPQSPPPHILRFDQQYFSSIPARHRFSLELVIIGDANFAIDDVIAAMQLLGKQGIAQQPAHLTQIEQVIPYDLPRSILTPQDHQVSSYPPLPEMPDKVTAQFITPYIIHGTGKQAFDSSQWVMSIIRRIALLQNTYTDVALTPDFRALKAQTQQLPFSRPELYLYETEHSRQHHYSGLLGSVDLHLSEQPELWPWLHLGQWLHVGKRTSYGFGAYRLARAAG